MPCGDGISEYSCPHHSSSRECRTRRLRECNEERVAASSTILLLSSAITNPSAQRGDYGQTLQSGQANKSSTGVVCPAGTELRT
ncbi:jg22918 [Pararge aegeria aegeria]|uniref:Jg22918 protein n=1 Tax=Pararge aegeria aegeria TaxID=348720 RepID=A0A8S4R1J0_9NEOP|nr:jg22918 [Pararge aegeria aegeria]